ncbi:hypothetical protein PAXRUDRAFT_140745, partial [Paxillus rubicundulus Ve08.2h10]
DLDYDDATQDPAAWSIVLDFANGTINSLPVAKNHLHAHLGTQFSFPQWKPAFDAIFGAEEDTSRAVFAVNKLWMQALASASTDTVPSAPSLPSLKHAETQLMQAVDDLHSRKCIRGTQPTLEDLLNPTAKKEVSNSLDHYPGGDIDIIKEVKEMFKVTKSGSDDPADGELSSADNNNDTAPVPTPCQGMDLCEQLEGLCLHHTEADSLDINSFQCQLQKLCAHLRKVHLNSQTQMMLDNFFR